MSNIHLIPIEEPKPIHQQIIDAVGGKDRFREIAKIKPKQETIEEAADNYSKELTQVVAFYQGAKWEQQRSYSEEEVLNKLTHFAVEIQRQNKKGVFPLRIKEWFERNKNK